MPHVIVKMYPGRAEQEKNKLADEIVKALMSTLQAGEGSISVAIEEVNKEDWAEKVYIPEIEGKQKNLYKKPGYKL